MKEEYFREETPGYLIVLVERLEHEQASEFGRALLRYIKNYKVNITLDCSRTTNIDTIGLAFLIEAKSKQQERDLSLKLENLREQLKQVIDMHGARKYLQTEKAEEIHECQPK